MSTTNVTTTTQTTSVTVQENTVLIELNNVGIQGNPGANNDPTYVTVRNSTGATLAKGTIVYISGANGNNVQVTPAIATGDTTSARTLGWLAADIANNGSGLCMVEGYLEGLNTQGFTAGAQLYLSGTTAGAFTATKPQAPIHLVYVGVVTKVSSGDGHVFVKVQNGYELEELHNVQIVNPTNAQVLAYDSATQLWKNATNAPDGVTSITATAPLTGGTITSTGSIGLNQALLSITKSQVSDFTSGTVTSASTAQQSGTALFATNAGTATFATTSGTATYATTSGTAVTILGSITKNQVSDFASGTVAQATNASTATYATTSGTAVYSTNSGTAVYATTSGTAVNISGTVTQSQVTNLTSDLALKAPLASPTFSGTVTLPLANTGLVTSSGAGVVGVTSTAPGLGYIPYTGSVTGGYAWQDISLVARDNTPNAFTVGGHTITPEAIGVLPLRINGLTGQTSDLLSFRDPSNNNNLSVSPTYGLVGRNAGTLSFAISSVGGLAAFYATAATSVNMLLRGAVSHTADTLQVQDVNANILGGFSATGRLLAGGSSTTAVGSVTLGAPTSTVAQQLGVVAREAGTVGVVVRGAASQSASLLEIQNSAGSVLVSVTSAGNLNAPGQVRVGTTSGLGQLAVVSTNAATIGAVVQGASNQTADTMQYQASAGTVLGGRNAVGQAWTGSTSPITTAAGGTIQSIATGANPLVTMASAVNLGVGDLVTLSGTGSGTYNGTFVVASAPSASTFTITTSLTAGQGFPSGTIVVPAQKSITARSAGTIGAIVRGASGAVANLQEWQNSAGTVLAKVGSGGVFNAVTVSTTNGYSSLQEASSGGNIFLSRMTAQATSPGANNARLYLRDGTNAGTLKLVVRAGAAGAETTILDNIPQ